MFSIEKPPTMPLCPIKRFSFIDTLFYVMFFGVILYLLFGLFEDYCPFKKIDKCPLASVKDQRMSILENKIDKIMHDIDHIWEVINDTESEASDDEEIEDHDHKDNDDEDLIPEHMLFHMMAGEESKTDAKEASADAEASTKGEASADSEADK